MILTYIFSEIRWCILMVPRMWPKVSTCEGQLALHSLPSFQCRLSWNLLQCLQSPILRRAVGHNGHFLGSVPSIGPALGYWVKEGVGLVVHFPLEDIAKINTQSLWLWFGIVSRAFTTFACRRHIHVSMFCAKCFLLSMPRIHAVHVHLCVLDAPCLGQGFPGRASHG